jgi:hypothetical protein
MKFPLSLRQMISCVTMANSDVILTAEPRSYITFNDGKTAVRGEQLSSWKLECMAYFKHNPGIRLERLKKTTANFRQQKR